MPEVKRTLKIVTEQKITGDATSEMPLREWSIELHLLGSHGEDVPADCFEKVTYKLHETFGQRATQSISARSDSIPASAFHYLSNEIVKLTYILRTAFKTPPFRIQEEGWGEFDMVLVLNPKDKGAEITVGHDLNFQNEHYETKHPIVFKNPKPALLAILKESGPVPGDANGVKAREESAKKKKRPDKGIDMEKLAENMQKMTEDDLLLVVQMIHDNKTADTWTKNDVDQGEFQVDLYTLPDSLIRQLWDFTNEKIGR